MSSGLETLVGGGGGGGGGYGEKWPFDILLSASLHLPLGCSEVGAALLFAVVVELALPVHHVGGPAVELHLPLTLRLVDVVWMKGGGEGWG